MHDRLRAGTLRPEPGIDGGSHVNARRSSSALLPGGAAEAPTTRRWLRRRSIGCLVVVLVGVAMLTVGIVMRATQDDGRLQATGTRATATVEAVRLVREGSGGGTSSLVDIRFLDDAGTAYDESIHLGRSAPHYTVGQMVDIVYEPADPRVLQIVGRPAHGATVPWWILVVLGSSMLVIAVATARRVRWQRRVLRANPWVEVPARLLEVPMSGGSRHAITLVELRGAPDDGNVLAASAMWRARPMVDLTPRAWVAGSDRRFIVAAVGGAPLVRAKRVRVDDSPTDGADPGAIPPSRLHPAG